VSTQPNFPESNIAAGLNAAPMPAISDFRPQITAATEAPPWLLNHPNARLETIDGQVEFVFVTVCETCRSSLKACRCGSPKVAERLAYNRGVGLNQMLIDRLVASAKAIPIGDSASAADSLSAVETASTATAVPMSLKDYALWNLSQGFRVFALKEKQKEPDSELSMHGFQSSTNEVAAVEHIWSYKPQANIGIDCGGSDLCIFDFASPEDIPAWAKEIKTMKVTTSGGKMHVYTRGARPTAYRTVVKITAPITSRSAKKSAIR
jgi:Bifunctional DNA primase/polymerase, N-terminal